MDDIYFRIRAVERAVSRGVQDPRDVEDVKAHGRVTRPSESMSHALAREYVAVVDSGKRSKREIQ